MKLNDSVRRILSALLVFVLVFSMVPMRASAATVVDAAVIFSDLHTSKSNYKESNVKGIMTAIKNAGLPVSSVTSAGDAFSVNEDSGKYTGLTGTITGYIQSVLGNVPVNYVWSDHDRYAVQADGKTLLDNDSGFIYGAGADGLYGTDDDGNYYIYELSMADLSTNNRYNADFHSNAEVTAAIAAFSNAAAQLKKDRPLFIASHQPLLDRRNDNGHAYEWAIAINEVAKSMDVAFFFGHNHRHDVASDYYYAKGSTMSVCTSSSGSATNMVLNFAHICAGYMEPTSTSSYSSTTRKGVAVAITIYEDSVRYVTYDANGVYTGSYALDVTIPRAFANADVPSIPETDPTEPSVPETTEPEPTEPEATEPEVPQEGTIWRQASTITNGKKYLLVNYGFNASGIGTYAVNGSAGATEVEVLTDASGAYIVNDDASLAWVAKANSSQFEMANAENGKYLRAANYVYGNSGSNITVNSSTSSGSTYTNWSMETKSGKTILAVRRATSGNYYPVRYTGSAFQAFNSSQVSSQNNWLVIFEETEERAGHDHVNKTVTVEATCTEAGSVTTTCTICGEETVEVIPALGHDYACVTTDATCAKDGSKVYTCSRCGDTYSETIPATGSHSWQSTTLDATCTESGSITTTCTVCGEQTVEVIAPLGHSYVSSVTGATCETDGYTTYTCTACGHSYTADVVEAYGHSYDSVCTATCTEAGFVVYTCSACGYSYEGEAVAAYGHSYTTTVVAPTCATSGYTTYLCTACGYTYTGDEVAALGHDYASVVTAPTCEAGGYTTYTCSVCGHSYVSNEVAALGHAYESVVTPPTFEEEGYTTHTCTVCGDVKVDSFVPVLSHTYETVTVEPTCTESGSVTHTCVDCGYSYVEVLEALGHNYETVTTEATCERNGSVVSTCTRCGDTETEVIPATGHSYEVTEVSPTCTEVGYITSSCACGHVVTEEIPALGHSYEHSYTAPTCTENGADTYTCACGHVVTEGIPALGHSYSSVSQAPTCEDGGYTTYTCGTCGHSYVSDEIAALGHDYASVVTAPTCTASGYTTYTCTVCGDSYTGSSTAALGHNYTTAESDGYLVYTCGTCGHSYSEKIENLTYTKVNSISSDNRYVLTLTSGSKYYALSHANNQISVVQVTVSNNQITSDITEDLVWTYESGKLSYQDGNTTYYLYAQPTSGWFAWFSAPTLTLSTTNSTSITFSSNKVKMSNYYLRYSGGSVSLNRSASTASFFVEE